MSSLKRPLDLNFFDDIKKNLNNNNNDSKKSLFPQRLKKEIDMMVKNPIKIFHNSNLG